MGKNVDKFRPRTPGPAKANLPAAVARRAIANLMEAGGGADGKIPNAALIYGIAAAALAAIGVGHMVGGHWITGCLVLLPAGVFLGFAVYYLRPDR